MRDLNKQLMSKALAMGVAMALSLSSMSTPVLAAAGPQCVMECNSPAGLLDRVLAALGLR